MLIYRELKLTQRVLRKKKNFLGYFQPRGTAGLKQQLFSLRCGRFQGELTQFAIWKPRGIYMWHSLDFRPKYISFI